MLHRGYEAWISDADGKQLTEYSTEIDSADGTGRTVACLIPSESGKRFSIHWKDHSGLGHHFSARAFVDGMCARGKICKPGDKASRVGMRTTDAYTYRTFQFAELQTTDNDDAPMSVNSLGIIELRILHIHPETRSKPFRPAAFAGVGAVHERSKKAGAHCVTLGDTVSTSRPRGQSSYQLLNPQDGPFVTFIFRYRSAAILQAEGIMPSSSSKKSQKLTSAAGTKSGPSGASSCDGKPRPAAEDVIELTDDDEDYQLALSRVNKRPPASPVKQEMPPHKRVKYDPDDVINLT